VAAPQRPSAGTWILAAVELVAAALIAWLLIARSGDSASHQHMAGTDMADTVSSVASWGWPEFVAGLLAVAAVLWWLASRYPIAALVAGAALVGLTCLSTVRILAVQSHLFAMVALELLLVAAPLLLLAAVKTPPRHSTPRDWGGGATVLAVAAALAYVGLLIGVHLPGVHRAAAEEGIAPLWFVVLALAVGVCYWAAVLRTGARVPRVVRLAILLGAQEVAAFIGLLSLFGAWAPMGHAHLLGLSAGWDQRLGGVFMMATCAAVAIPVARGLQADRGSDDRGTLD